MNPVTKKHLIKAAKKLEDFLEDAAFVGGAILHTYLPKNFEGQTRITYDLDIVIRLTHYGRLEDLNERLATIGFYPDKESSIICRYTDGELLLDVMPTKSKILGFTNQWYEEGLDNKEWISLNEETSIPRFTLPYYLAAKWEAVKNRGKNDWRMSKDMEDIITLVNYGAIENLVNPKSKVLEYLKDSFRELIDHRNGREIILSHLSGVDRTNVGGILRDLYSFSKK
ncbi:hypothetical protein [Rhodohalobacter sp. 614A]|uniref:hypothetical protein n=1 Tax=Rhodohalobacter sp. 614A TaxID=2908649 RepID=UPI001F2AB923|nr:hypothetical protein [Rhodohalobacter sp. 614A]